METDSHCSIPEWGNIEEWYRISTNSGQENSPYCSFCCQTEREREREESFGTFERNNCPLQQFRRSGLNTPGELICFSNFTKVYQDIPEKEWHNIKLSWGIPSLQLAGSGSLWQKSEGRKNNENEITNTQLEKSPTYFCVDRTAHKARSLC